MQNEIVLILKSHEEYLENLNKSINSQNFIFNQENLDKNYSQIKAIVVMDNPGEEEKEEHRYLVGTAGKAFNKVWRDIGLKRSEVLLFNKSSYYTPSTQNLLDLYENKNICDVFLEEIEKNFLLILKIQSLLKVPLLVHGYSAYLKNTKIYIQNEKANRPLYLFFKLLKENKKTKNFTYFYKHSSYGNLSKQVQEYKEKNNLKKFDFKDYLLLGKEISSLFFK